jgi:predicted kinase
MWRKRQIARLTEKDIVYKPKAYILVGLPGSGKTTWFTKQNFDLNKVAYVSTDNWVHMHADSVRKTYSEVFESYMSNAVNLMLAQVRDAKAQGKDIVWDQTSTTIVSRKRKFNMLYPEYEMICIYCMYPDKQEWERRLASRPGKVIPKYVLEKMVADFEYPRLSEGFSEIRLAL